MRRQLATIRGRTTAVAVSIVLAGAVTAGAHATMQEASAAAAREREAHAHSLAQKKAEILAASRTDLDSDARRLVTRAQAALAESAGRVEEGLRTELDAAIQSVEAARVDGDRATVLASTRALRVSLERVEAATDAHDEAAAPVTPASTPPPPAAPVTPAAPPAQQPAPAAQQPAQPAPPAQQEASSVAAEREAARVAAEREAARVAAEQEAARVSGEREAARVAAEQEAARVAAEQEAARVAAEQEAARLAAEQEGARLAAEQECGRLADEQEAARLAAAGEEAASPTGDQAASIDVATPTPAALVPDAASTPPVVPTISGTLHVRQRVDVPMPEECLEFGRHADLVAGTPVIVMDAQGVPVGTGQLIASDDSSTDRPSQNSDEPAAVFSYVVPVTAVAEKYTIVVGSQVWDVIADAAFRANGWTADLTVE